MATQLKPKLPKNQEKVLCYMAENTASKKDVISSTVIGKEVGGEQPNGQLRTAPWAIPILKKLIEKEFACKKGRGEYSITTEGRRLAKKLLK